MTARPSPLDHAPVIPVAVIRDARDAVPIARALVDGGLPVIEVTLRTTAALEAIACIAAEVPDIALGAGTVRDTSQPHRAATAGAQFLVSPGSTMSLRQAMRDSGLPHLPGVATVSEMMTVAEEGYTDLKFFPAQAAGGTALLHACGSPLPDLRFCPTGGITAANARDYLDLPNVACIGGSWLTPEHLIRQQDWAAISRMAAQCRALTATPREANYFRC